MYKNQRILALIVARAGSKGLPGKNVMQAGGRPLISWTIAAAQQAALLDRVILSTDCRRSIAVATKMGCEAPFVRPAALCTDEADISDTILHALDTLEGAFDFVVLLQATSPLRTGADIDGAIRTCVDHNAAACISVAEPPKSPYWMFKTDDAGRLQPLMGPENAIKRRQELPPVYAPNGAVYVARVDWFHKYRRFVGPDTVPFVMPYDRSVDVDHMVDIRLFEALIPDNGGGHTDEFIPERQLRSKECADGS